MKFDFIGFILNPLVLIFLTMTLGNIFGNIKIKKFSFGITGTLFIGLIVGYILTKYSVNFVETSKYYGKAQQILKGNVIDKNISNLSLMIFIVGTGLLAAKDMRYAIKKFGKQFVFLAVFIPLVGALTSYGFSKLLNDISPFQITGTYTGALTSSAGLAAATESSDSESQRIALEFATMDKKVQEKVLAIINNAKVRDARLKHQENPTILTIENTKELTKDEVETFVIEAKAGVGIGHSIGYPFGVLFLILGINFIPKIFRFDIENEKKKYFKEKARDLAETKITEKKVPEVKMDFIGFSLAAFLGYILGNVKIYLGVLGYFSLGSIGGAIIVSLILGFIGKIGFINFRMDSVVLGKMRTYFLSIFLAATGLNFGYRVIEAVTGDGLMIATVASGVAIISVFTGFLVGHYIFHINWTLLSGAITGGMTSAPGLGAAIDSLDCDEPAIAYGATQPLATLCMVIFSIIIHKLPL